MENGIELPVMPDPNRMQVRLLDCDHCNECGKPLSNGAFFCSDKCIRKSIKLNKLMRDT